MVKRAGGNKRIELAVEKLDGEVLCHWSGERASTGRDVKEQVHRLHGVCPCLQQLLFGQALLGDGDTVGEVIPDTRKASLTLLCREPPSRGDAPGPVELGRLKTVERFCARCLREAGFGISELVDAGWRGEGKELRRAGFSAHDFVDSTYCAPFEHDTAFVARRLYSAGFSATEIKEALGASAGDLPGYMGAGELKQAGFSAEEVYEAGACSYMAAGYSAEEMRRAGYSAEQLRRAGYFCWSLKEGGFDLVDLRKAGFNAAELGFYCKFSRDELVKAGFTAKDMLAAGFNARQLREAGVSAGQMKKVGFNASRLRKAGFDARQLRAGGFDARQMKAASFNACDLQAAGFPARELTAAGFSSCDAQDQQVNARKGKRPTIATGQLVCRGDRVLDEATGDAARQMQRPTASAGQLDADGKRLRRVHIGSLVALLISCLLAACIRHYAISRRDQL